MEHQPFDLRECVESALDLTSGRAIEKGLDIAYIMEDDVPAGIKGDVTRLRQILINFSATRSSSLRKVKSFSQFKKRQRPKTAIANSPFAIQASAFQRVIWRACSNPSRKPIHPPHANSAARVWVLPSANVSLK